MDRGDGSHFVDMGMVENGLHVLREPRALKRPDGTVAAIKEKRAGRAKVNVCDVVNTDKPAYQGKEGRGPAQLHLRPLLLTP
ncbi:hypothetical protein Q7C36_004700 [Tachysurus vachellii]|uniref:Uncharacterized protein n=1 Tax=Tachysurus vachellii TaxID=175792 RepID=A0AA88NMM3_TACVA|nr:hypothetical protein Q7C36_004700 [Tachysurus vachellii]